jgi:transcriptional regulator with XRE-family HTH domain
MSERDTFGPRLRSERERRNISLETIASVTKVSADLWDGLERNDFSRWPSGIFARAFVRDYARAIGLDEDEVLNEFCRLFPIGDRRVSRLIQAQAQLIGHDLEYTEPGAVPDDGDRRAIPTVAERNRLARAKFTPRTVAATLDITCTLSLSALVNFALGIGFSASVGVVAVLYYGLSTVLVGVTPGVRATTALRQRVPALFTMPERRRATA